MTSQEEFFNSQAGESHDPIKFEKIGDKCGGTVMTEPRPIQRPSLRDANVMETQLPINLMTGDGPRTLWVRVGFMASAIKEAVIAAGETGIKEGATLAVAYVEDRDTGKPNKAKIFKAKYEPPPKQTGGASIDDIFAEPFEPTVMVDRDARADGDRTRVFRSQQVGEPHV